MVVGIFEDSNNLILMMNHRGWFKTPIPKKMNAMTSEDITTQNIDRKSLNI